MRYVPHTENGCGKVSEYKKAVAYRVAVFFHVYVYGENKWIGLILHFIKSFPICRTIEIRQTGLYPSLVDHAASSA